MHRSNVEAAPNPPPRRPSPFGGITMAEALDGLRIMSGLPPSFARCGVCGGPYRPDPRSAVRCGWCGGQDWRWGG
jgi:hypothetical protein